MNWNWLTQLFQRMSSSQFWNQWKKKDPKTFPFPYGRRGVVLGDLKNIAEPLQMPIRNLALTYLSCRGLILSFFFKSLLPNLWIFSLCILLGLIQCYLNQRAFSNDANQKLSLPHSELSQTFIHSSRVYTGAASRQLSV